MKRIILLFIFIFVLFSFGCEFPIEKPVDTECIIKVYDGNTLIETIKKNKGDDFPNPTFEKEGYQFVGWDLDRDGNPDKLPIAVTTHANLYAIYIEEITYQCIFAHNGEAVKSDKVKPGTKVEYFDLTINDDEKYNYEFHGWDSNGDGNPEVFPYEINADTIFYPIISGKTRLYKCNIYINDQLYSTNELCYGDEIVYPDTNSLTLDGKFYLFECWEYYDLDNNKIDEEFIKTINQDLVIKAKYTDKQVFTAIYNDESQHIHSMFIQSGEKINLNYGKPNKDEIIVWYTDSEFTNKLLSNIMVDGSLTIYGRYEKLKEIDTSLLDYNYEGVDTVYSEYELLLLFNSLILNKIPSKEVTLNFEYESLEKVFEYLNNNCLEIHNFKISISYVDNVVNFKFTFDEKGGKTSDKTVYTQLNTFNDIDNNYQKRTSDYDDFYINKVEKTYKVIDSDSLYYCLEHGYKPIIENNDELKLLYENIKNILRDIISDEMNEFEKAKAIYEWIVMNVIYDDVVLKESLINPNGVNKYNCFLLEGVFNDKKAVCDGISKAYVVMANIEGIKSVRATGHSVLTNINHAWNKVFIDGNWYIVDATSGGIINSENEELLTYEYFLTNEEHYSKYYIDDKNMYSFINTDYIYDSYKYIYKNINGNVYDLSIDSFEEAVIVFKEFLKLDKDFCFSFELSYFDGNNIQDEISKIAFETNINNSFNYFANGNIITVYL